jgi:hypothetical protein
VNYRVRPASSDYVIGLRSWQDDLLSLDGGIEFGFDNGWKLALKLRRELGAHMMATGYELQISWGEGGH